jgi:hypothetical protein
MRVVIVTDAGLVIGVQDLSGKTIDADGRAARGMASYTVETPDGPEVVEYEAVVEAPPGCRFVASEDALPGWTWTPEAGCQPPQPEPPTAAELIAYARNRRWQIEVGGKTVAGVPIATDDRAKIMIIGARFAASLDANWQTVWQGTDGNGYPVDAATMVTISDAIHQHVNATFATLAAVLAAITAETITTKEEIDQAFAQAA